jgi:hypothetical protein
MDRRTKCPTSPIPIIIKLGNNKEGMNTLLQDSRKSRGRPKASWTQADTARELGISQQAVSNCIQIARAIEAIPALAGLKGTAILKALRILRNPEGDCSALADDEVRKAFQFIVSHLKSQEGIGFPLICSDGTGGKEPLVQLRISPYFPPILNQKGGKT